jgi:hypothetical protein
MASGPMMSLLNKRNNLIHRKGPQDKQKEKHFTWKETRLHRYIGLPQKQRMMRARKNTQQLRACEMQV